MGKNPRYLPDICESAGLLRDAVRRGEALCNVMCASCDFFRPADLDAIVEAKGYDYDLADRRPRCPTPGCRGRVIFHYGFSVGSPTRPLYRRR